MICLAVVNLLFADYEQASFRQYQRLTKQHKPDMQEYSREKEKLYATFRYKLFAKHTQCVKIGCCMLLLCSVLLLKV